ncbi:MAG: GGDEF domain-containing protein [Devosia sp. 67-54]|uniref:GGDEF domain-containing protein n=1 Tax=unclassified Devosia TaxID=196773 RepID=UPI00095B6FCC|nr:MULTISPECIES: GGDEF domain-containing protein [unclassified Devosia]MBN9306105.1 GGDEF domain-containing protein [Devosia sp.]OJX16228.1 MAG: GGDEF domain-containing protein [Devosia sp. 67-54]
MKLDLSPVSWGRVIFTTVVGTAICVAAAIYVDSFNFASFDGPTRLRALLADVLLPTVLAVPFLLFFSGKLRELAIAHEKLTVYASTDSLTQVMNRGAFSTLVDAYLGEIEARQVRGALLIIDADHFKSVNDRYGHERGDEALVRIAQAIKSVLRSPDLVGRLGGEEFGVFLPGVDPGQAEHVAERIRKTIRELEFRPAGAEHRLSVSVGGAVFDRPLPLRDILRIADRQLYRAKEAGRDRVSIGPALPDGLLEAA